MCVIMADRDRERDRDRGRLAWIVVERFVALSALQWVAALWPKIDESIMTRHMATKMPVASCRTLPAASCNTSHRKRWSAEAAGGSCN